MVYWIRRSLRIAAIAAVTYAAYRFLEPRGYGWAVLIAALIGSAAYIAWFRRRRARRTEHPWEAALREPARRPKAIADVRAARDSEDDPEERAALCVLLSQLHTAQGELPKAGEALADIKMNTLGCAMTGTVRHAKASLALSRGDVAVASKELEDMMETGDAELDARLALLAAYVRVEEGAADDAIERARQIRANTDDVDLQTEARVVRAAALDQLGQNEEAERVLVALGEDVIEALAELGLPRVRTLARSIRGE